ncbi:MAG TPA: 16S rRNA (cytidine(1402)-2'-O)-methyltransferase [Thermomicrobiaceae bacterium]|nr:16S rRNA (cytidine(1402)-2'-O)-methyltransferase [Thermomicrobiaceae bacterium]
MGTLYLVGTPIGNLEDITLRALRVLREVDLIASEDTRHSGRLLKHYGISTPLVSYHEHSGRGRLAELLAALEAGDVALISDAGTPGISDPGYELVRAAAERGIPVAPIPGPSALTAAVPVSGLAPGGFVYLGFLPRRPTERRALLESMADLAFPLVLYEAPHRLPATLTALEETLGDRPLALARELTKLHEEVDRTTLSAARARFATEAPRGEFVLVVGPAEPGAAPEVGEDELRELLRRRLAAGETPAAAAKAVARETGQPRRRLYDLTRELGRGEST